METVTIQLPKDLYEAMMKFFAQRVATEQGEVVEYEPQARIIPSLNDVVEEVKRTHTSVNAQRFFNYYQKRDWRTNSGETFDWKEKLAEWGTYGLEKQTVEKPEEKKAPVYNFTAQDAFVFEKKEAVG